MGRREDAARMWSLVASAKSPFGYAEQAVSNLARLYAERTGRCSKRNPGCSRPGRGQEESPPVQRYDVCGQTSRADGKLAQAVAKSRSPVVAQVLTLLVSRLSHPSNELSYSANLQDTGLQALTRLSGSGRRPEVQAEALLSMVDIYEGSGKKDLASKSVLTLLQFYPMSQALQSARPRLGQLCEASYKKAGECRDNMDASGELAALQLAYAPTQIGNRKGYALLRTATLLTQMKKVQGSSVVPWRYTDKSFCGVRHSTGECSIPTGRGVLPIRRHEDGFATSKRRGFERAKARGPARRPQRLIRAWEVQSKEDASNRQVSGSQGGELA